MLNRVDRGLRLGNFKRIFLHAVLLLIILLSNQAGLFAQFLVEHSPKNFLQKSSNVELAFQINALEASQLNEVYLMYQTDVDPNWIRIPAVFSSSGAATVRINTDITGASEILYYFVAELTDGSKITFPDASPAMNPVRVSLDEAADEENVNQLSGEVKNVEYTILSPEPGTKVYGPDLVVAITLFYEEGDAATDDFTILVNGQDVTEKAEISPYFISYVPENPTPGASNVEVKLGKTTLTKFDFETTDQPIIASPVYSNEKKGSITANAELTARNQVIAGSANDVLRGNFRVNGNYGAMRFSVNGLGTTQEDPRLQPQNRLAAELYLGKWFEIQAGHIYPRMNTLIMNGARVFGVNSALHLLNQNINFQITYGELAREIPSLYNRIEYDPQVVTSQNEVTGQLDTLAISDRYSLGFQDNGFGTFRREIIAGRFGLGNGKHFAFGINAIKVEDDINSILLVDSLAQVPGELLPTDPARRDSLLANPDLLEIQGGTQRPKGNFMVATDLAVNMFKNKFRIRADVAASLLNEDISPGVLNQQRAEDLGFDLDEEITDLLDQLSIILVVNENLRSLPIRFVENAQGEYDTEVFVPTGIFGGQGSAGLNVLNNNITFRYQWMGPDFQPLSNTAVRRDIAGYSLTDRISLLKNRVYLNVGYDEFTDNVLQTLDNTTTTTTVRGGISVYPFNLKLPRLSFDYRQQTRENGLSQDNPFVVDPSVAVRNVRQVTADSTILLGTARNNITDQYNGAITQQLNLFGMIQDITASYTIINTVDQVFAFGDFDSEIINIGVKNRFTNLPLQVNGSYQINNSDILGGTSKLQINGFQFGAEMYFLNEKLVVSGNLAALTTVNSSQSLEVNDSGTPDDFLDDFYEASADVTKTETASYILNARALYRINKNHAISASMNLTNVENRLGGPAVPNDRILQARYIINF